MKIPVSGEAVASPETGNFELIIHSRHEKLSVENQPLGKLQLFSISRKLQVFYQTLKVFQKKNIRME